ncbi:FYVE, RhoGEF and PH domain-containing protein 6 [Nymphon striatum]|nr:FYVE, RhoGEF and PH domain-containing protein 6 [Nymphon striatum]
MIDDEESAKGSRQSLSLESDPEMKALNADNLSPSPIQSIPSIEITDESKPNLVQTDNALNEKPAELNAPEPIVCQPSPEPSTRTPQSSPRSTMKSTTSVQKFRNGRPYHRKTCPVADGEASESSEYDDSCCMPTSKLSVIIKNVLSDTPHQPAIAPRSFSSPAQAIYESKPKPTPPKVAPKPRPGKPPPRPKPPDLSKRMKKNNLENVTNEKSADDEGTEDSGDYKDISFKKKEPSFKSPYEEFNFMNSSGFSKEDLNEDGDYHPYEVVGAQSSNVPSSFQPSSEKKYEKINVCSAEDLAPTGNISEIESVYDEQVVTNSNSAESAPCPLQEEDASISMEGESGDTTDTLSFKESLASEYLTPALSTASIQNQPITSDASDYNDSNEIFSSVDFSSLDASKSKQPNSVLEEPHETSNVTEEAAESVYYENQKSPEDSSTKSAEAKPNDASPKIIPEISSPPKEVRQPLYSNENHPLPENPPVKPNVTRKGPPPPPPPRPAPPKILKKPVKLPENTEVGIKKPSEVVKNNEPSSEAEKVQNGVNYPVLLKTSSTVVPEKIIYDSSSTRSAKVHPITFTAPQIMDSVSKTELQQNFQKKYSNTKETFSSSHVSSNTSQKSLSSKEKESVKSGSYSIFHEQYDEFSSSQSQGSYRKISDAEYVNSSEISHQEVKSDSLKMKNKIVHDELIKKIESKNTSVQKVSSTSQQSTCTQKNFVAEEKSVTVGSYSFEQAAADSLITSECYGSFRKLSDPDTIKSPKKESDAIKSPKKESDTIKSPKKAPPARPPPPQPKRPPRKKQRSHTAVVSRQEVTEARERFQRSRRSQSLTEADLAKRLWMAEKPVRPPIDIKTLYTKVQKESTKGSLVDSVDSSKQKLDIISNEFEKFQAQTQDKELTEDNVQCRPLPAPPPPPRTKKRSADSTPSTPAFGKGVPPKFSQERAVIEARKLLESNSNTTTKPDVKGEYEEKKEKPFNFLRKIRRFSNSKSKARRTYSDPKKSNTLDLSKLGKRPRAQSMFYVTDSSGQPQRERSNSIGSDLSSAYDSLYPRTTSWYDDGDAADESNVSSHIASMDEEAHQAPNSDVENSSNVRKSMSSVLSSRSGSGRKKDEKVDKKKPNSGDIYCYEFQEKSETSDTESIKIRIRIEKKTERGGEEKVVVKRSVPIKEIIRVEGRECHSQPPEVNRLGSEISPSDSLSQIPDIVSHEEADMPTPIIKKMNSLPTFPQSDRHELSDHKSKHSSHKDTLSSASDSWHTAFDSSSDSGDVEVDNRFNKDKMYLIAREIMTTECTYNDVLKLINNDFRSYIQECKDPDGNPVILQANLDQVFKYLPQLQKLNENFYLDLCNRVKKWDETPRIADIVVKIGPFFKLYSSYVSEFESMNSQFDELCKKNTAFAKALKEFEMTKRCKMLALKHYMLKPVQRVPQYKLLLEKYLKHVPEETEEHNDAETALAIVSKVADHINQSIKDVDNFNKMIEIQSNIVGNCELIQPGRMFIKEGSLNKLSRKGAQARWFTLFNDCLLYMSPIPQGYKINYNIPLTGLKVMIPTQEDYQNEFSIISIIRSFSLSASSKDERESWITAINNAILINASRRNTFNNIHNIELDSQNNSDVTSFTLGHHAPVWIPDSRASMCQICTTNFTVTFRRHHCRTCGKVVCKRCSANKVALKYEKGHLSRVCDECFQIFDTKMKNVGGVSVNRFQLNSETESDITESESSSSGPSVTFKPQPKKQNPKFLRRKLKGKSALEEVTANDQCSDMSGYLHLKVKKNWKKSWFVIKEKVLYAYAASEDIKALESTPLLGYEVSVINESVDGCEDGIAFELSHRGRPAMIFYAENKSMGQKHSLQPDALPSQTHSCNQYKLGIHIFKFCPEIRRPAKLTHNELEDPLWELEHWQDIAEVAMS